MNSANNNKSHHITSLIIESMVNFPIHYNPKKILKKNDNNNLLMGNYANKINAKYNSLSKYAKAKNKNKITLIKKLQRNKIDIFINRIFDQNNNYIRDYNYKNSNKELPKIKQLTSGTKEIIKDDILVKYNNFLRHKNAFIKSPLKYNKEYIWSQKILEEKRLKEYRRIYSLKHLKGEDKFTFENWKNSLKIVKNIIEEKKKRNKTFSGPYFSPKKYK
jgi:hypothetical protein